MSRRLALAMIALLGPSNVLHAQQLTGRDQWADSARVRIDAATQHNDVAALETTRVMLDRALAVFPRDPLLLHYLGYSLFREAILSIRDPAAKNEVGDLLQAAQDALEQSADKLKLPETYALESAVYGQKIGLRPNPLTIMRLGPRTNTAMAEAIASGPRNPRVWLLRGIGAMFRPRMWGGGTDKAESYLMQAVSLYDTDYPTPPLPAWGHAEAYIWLGQAYTKDGKRAAARDAFQKAITLEPDNQWARQLLASTYSTAQGSRETDITKSDLPM
ncbi:MAG: tetratricopeptide repeat protein [Gemmatimonadaceae bacterium]